ncbi:MAG: hypothetical protein K2X27_15300 [Candidatus Obscuribacterales bacterium]|nr:hypothetical protein [Candidatus Obscuribacterales bacterium]
MENNTKLSTDAKRESIAFCERVFTHVSGNAHIYLNGELAGFDRKRKEVFIHRQGKNTIWMPAAAFLKNLSNEEIDSLNNLPAWDGNNAWLLSGILLYKVECSIRRFRQWKICSAWDSDSFDYFPGASTFREHVNDGVVVRREC